MIFAAVIVLMWVGCGLYAKSLERAAQDPTPTPLLLALLKGPLAMRDALIFTTLTLPPVLLDDTAAAPEARPAAPAFVPAAPASVPPPVSVAPPAASWTADPVEEDLAARPDKLPRRPMAGTVKAPCPVCQETTKHAKDAVCRNCLVPNRWLLEEWGLQAPAATTPEPVAHHHDVEDAAIVASTTRADGELADLAGFEPAADPTVTLAAEHELEAYDALPSRPRMGKVKTVCPTCHEPTKHDRDGICQQCGQPNDWLRKRWDLLAADTELHFEPAPVTPQPSEDAGQEMVRFVAAPSRVARCSGCGRRAFADGHGNCAFCNTPLPKEHQ